VVVVGHLRREKDPFRAVRSLWHVDPSARIEVVQIGGALDSAMHREAETWLKREPRYRWLGSISHGATMRWLASSHALVVSSVMEGGANVICEAACIGVPVLASRIPGNIGMLGPDYPGYFPLFDDKALAHLIERCRNDAHFYATLRKAVLQRRSLFTPAAEKAALERAIQELPRPRLGVKSG